MDLSIVKNPYDFANPILEKHLFAGRNKELDEIRYYLNQVDVSSSPINLALLGDRASGKTSLLNMCEIEASERGFCAVRINLDEADALRINLFFKIFDAILHRVCELGFYGGEFGNTYLTYIDMISTYDVPEDKTFCPFVFPIQYAKVKSSGRENIELSDNMFYRDLRRVSSDIAKPLVLLFDEANILSTYRVNLKKIRNVFMNMPGYMLVLAGTQDLFPSINDVFSPIIRQFKKIDIQGFGNINETIDCIRKPLEQRNIKQTDVMDFEYTFFEDIHELTGGRPYEIKLICHYMFRRIQMQKSNKMKLSLGVLEEVRKELETVQDISGRPLITAITSLPEKHLEALSILCSMHNRATLYDIWTKEYIINAPEYWTYELLQQALDHLVTLHILTVNEAGIIRFPGDEFDKIYSKYFAREHKVLLNFTETSMEDTISNELIKKLQEFDDLELISEDLNLVRSLYDLPTDDKSIDIMDSFLECIIDISILNININTIFTKKSINLYALLELCKILMAYRHSNPISLMHVTGTILEKRIRLWFVVRDLEHSQEISDLLRGLQIRADSVQNILTVKLFEIPNVDPSQLLDLVLQLDEEQFTRHIINSYIELIFILYEKILSMAHNSLRGNLYFVLISDLKLFVHLFQLGLVNDMYSLNNLAYMLASTGDYEESHRIIVVAEKLAHEFVEELHSTPRKSDYFNIHPGLIYYNKAILGLLTGNRENAQVAIENCNTYLATCPKDVNDEVFECICLLYPQADNGTIKITEIIKPKLHKTALELQKFISDNV